MTILSFIIPVYNTGEYVEKCIQSILIQNLSTEDYEIIIVNDESTDNSSAVIEKVVRNRENIQVINQNNKGPGAARNTGLQYATGKYVFFVDSDDYLLPCNLNPLVEFAKKSDSDIIGFNWQEVYLSGKTVSMKRERELYDKNFLGAYCLNKYNFKGVVWAYIFSCSFLEKFSLSMPEGIYHEDELFISKVFVQAEKITFLDVCVYVYSHRENSTMTRRENTFLQRRISDSVFVIKELMAFGEKNQFTEIQQKGLRRKIDFLVVDMIINLIRMRMDRETIYCTMQELRRMGLYPLNDQFYSTKYFFFRKIFRNEKVIQTAARFRLI